MTNFEYWKDKILEITNGNDPIALENGEPIVCGATVCERCSFYSGLRCSTERIKWLYSEHEENPKLTKRERKLCEALGTGWIAADKSGKVYWYSDMPNKGYVTYTGAGTNFNLTGAGFHFDFMDFEDKEPWMVENLLQLEVEE